MPAPSTTPRASTRWTPGSARSDCATSSAGPSICDLDPRHGRELLHEAVERAGGDDPPAVDDDHTLAHHRHLGQDVRREDDRVGAGQRLDELPDADDLLGIEPDRRLVEDQHLRIGDERLGEADPLAVPLREPPDQPLAHVGDLAPLEHLADAAPPLAAARGP